LTDCLQGAFSSGGGGGSSGAMTQLAQVTSSGDTDKLDTGTITAASHLYWEIHSPDSGDGSDFSLQFNGETGTDYDNRYFSNGGADSTNTGADSVRCAMGADAPGFCYGHIKNVATVEKIMIAFGMVKTAGATAPERKGAVGGWQNTSDQITSIQLIREGEAFANGIVFTVWSIT